MVILLRIEMLIRQIREEKNISLEELSKKANVSKAHLSYIERNEKEPEPSGKQGTAVVSGWKWIYGYCPDPWKNTEIH